MNATTSTGSDQAAQDVPPRILLVDDDPRALELYGELLRKLPCQPEVHTANSGARAVAMLENGAFTLLVCDLNMPHMDGLQVLAIVRRKFPQLRTAVLTGLADEQFRMRAYAMGLDLYIEKPTTSEGVQQVSDCLESLIGQSGHSGFRGMQWKSLMDLVQLECLCRSSSVLKVTNGAQEGRIWFQDGEILDAAVDVENGEAAFQKVLAWQTGHFEILPADPAHPRTIYSSYQGLLLGSAQAVDEAKAGASASAGSPAASPARKALCHFKGVEFGVVAERAKGTVIESWAVENPTALAAWTRATIEGFDRLGDALRCGVAAQITGATLDHQVLLSASGEHAFCLGFKRSQPADLIQGAARAILAQWAS